MAKINELTFGSIIVAGKKYRCNVLIFTDVMVKRHKAVYRKESKLTDSAII